MIGKQKLWVFCFSNYSLVVSVWTVKDSAGAQNMCMNKSVRGKAKMNVKEDGRNFNLIVLGETCFLLNCL